jgi:MFS family permease
MEAVGVAASVLWPSVPGTFLATALLGGTFMELTALGLARARQLAPANPRSVLAKMTAAFGLGQIIGPSLAGYLFGVTGGFLPCRRCLPPWPWPAPQSSCVVSRFDSVPRARFVGCKPAEEMAGCDPWKACA